MEKGTLHQIGRRSAESSRGSGRFDEIGGCVSRYVQGLSLEFPNEANDRREVLPMEPTNSPNEARGSSDRGNSAISPRGLGLSTWDGSGILPRPHRGATAGISTRPD